MISSNHYEVRLKKGRGGREEGEDKHPPSSLLPPSPLPLSPSDLWAVRLDALELPWTGSELLAIQAEEPFAISVRRSASPCPRLRLRLGNERIADMPAGCQEFETEAKAWLRNEFGESRLVIEQEIESPLEDELASFTRIVELGLDVTPRPEVARDFRVMIEDVTAIHEGLAQDLINRAFLRRGLQGGTVSRLHPEAVLSVLHALSNRLEKALARIARQPSMLLERNARLARYRGGDRLDATALAYAARDPQTRIDCGGRVKALGRLRVRAPALSGDLPEHRHIAEGLRRLSRRAEQLARHCERAAELLSREEERWGRAKGGQLSVFAQHFLPRVQVLEDLAWKARRLGKSFEELLRAHDFLRAAGTPHTALAPTPTFLGRLPYREVYRALVRAQQPLGALVEGEEVRIAYRNLATLYEYWCFLRVFTYLRERLGVSAPWADLSLVDENYRPDLAPGQEFSFALGNGLSVVVAYEPEIRPWQSALRRGDRFGASLTREALRPDIALEIRSATETVAMLVLDAKSTDLFEFDIYRTMTDYARQVFDPRTWSQPIRQVFLLHRDRKHEPICNVPGYVQGRPIEPEVTVLGAVPCVPEQVNCMPRELAEVIDRFLEMYGRG